MKGRQDSKYELQYCYYRRKIILMHFIYIQIQISILRTSYEYIYLLVLLTPTDVMHRRHYFVCRLVCLW